MLCMIKKIFIVIICYFEGKYDMWLKKTFIKSINGYCLYLKRTVQIVLWVIVIVTMWIILSMYSVK